MSRPKIPRGTETELLVRSRRRCAFCFGLHLTDAPVKGQIAHVDRDPTNNALSNLALLCLGHHDEYDSRPSQSKGFTPSELAAYRADLYRFNESARAAMEPLRAYQRFSPEALRLAERLNQHSANGHKFDPMDRIEALPEHLSLTADDVELGIDELKVGGMIELNGSRDFVFPTNRLFWETDPLFTGNDPILDAQAVARGLVARDAEDVSMSELAEALGWPPRRLNPAATYLVESGHARDRAGLGSAPFWMFQIVRTTATKRLVRQLDRAEAK